MFYFLNNTTTDIGKPASLLNTIVRRNTNKYNKAFKTLEQVI